MASPRRNRRRALAGALVAAAVASAMASARVAKAGPFDLEDDDKPETKKDDKPAQAAPAPASSAAAGSQATTAAKPLLGEPPPPLATIRPHAYTLPECLALADRNHPGLWAARSRLAAVHAQLDEAKWTPYSYWGASSHFGVLPPLGGTPFYNAVPRSILNQGIGSGYQPFFQFGINGSLPLYTFGKIESIRNAAEAQVRFSEWDMEKNRQQIRMDVRRAYYGLMLAHDAIYIVNDVLGRLDDALQKINQHLERGDTSYDEFDKIRLELSRDELLARGADARKGEQFANAALRFLTGVQTAFDIPDEPLHKPDVVLGPVVRYLTAARLFRADVNAARAGVVARKALVDFARAQMYPNFGLGLSMGYGVAPSATPQNTAWIGDPFNGFGAGFAFGVDFPLDILPKEARLQHAESDLEEARALERLALGGTAVEVEQAYGGVVEAKTREENWEHAEHRTKHWISAVQDAIDLGTKDERALLEPLRAYVYARANHAQALFDLNVALSDLARVSGWDAAAPPS